MRRMIFGLHLRVVENLRFMVKENYNDGISIYIGGGGLNYYYGTMT